MEVQQKILEMLVKPDLPAVLARYFEAQNAHDTDALVACFAPDAVVRDEGEDIVGTDAIRAWKQATSAKYKVTAEPLECRAEDGQTVVVARVSGTFDGSPANLTYRFGLSEDGTIATLAIG
jgi:ketosteroid isomerase-like protein